MLASENSSEPWLQPNSIAKPYRFPTIYKPAVKGAQWRSRWPCRAFKKAALKSIGVLMSHPKKPGSRGHFRRLGPALDKADKLPILAVLRETQYFMQTCALINQTPAAITQSRTDNCLFSWKIAK
jgi:hypothetical protein